MSRPAGLPKRGRGLPVGVDLNAGGTELLRKSPKPEESTYRDLETGAIDEGQVADEVDFRTADIEGGNQDHDGGGRANFGLGVKESHQAETARIVEGHPGPGALGGDDMEDDMVVYCSLRALMIKRARHFAAVG